MKYSKTENGDAKGEDEIGIMTQVFGLFEFERLAVFRTQILSSSPITTLCILPNIPSNCQRRFSIMNLMVKEWKTRLTIDKL